MLRVRGPISLIRTARNLQHIQDMQNQDKYLARNVKEFYTYQKINYLETQALIRKAFLKEKVFLNTGLVYLVIHTLLVGHGSRTVMQYYQQN